MSWPLSLPQLPHHLPTPWSWRSTTHTPGPPVTRPTPPPITVLIMLRVQPSFAWRLELPDRKRARIDFVAVTCEVHVETKAGERTPAFRISFGCAINMAGVQLNDGEQLVGLYACRLRGGHWKLATVVLGTQGAAKGQVDLDGVMPISGMRGWGIRMEAHMDHAWLMMRFHAQWETRVHSGELAVVEGGGYNNGGVDDTRSCSSGGSRGPRVRGWGNPATPREQPPPPPPKSRWLPLCPKRRPSPSGSSGL